MTLSREDQALIAYVHDSGVPYVVTSTVNHSMSTSTGGTSRHVQQGTGGQGLAVDFAGRHGGRDTLEHAHIYQALSLVKTQLYELIYAGPVDGKPAVCYKAGKPFVYPKVVRDGHHDHVHAAVDKGVFLTWPRRPVPQPVPNRTVTHLHLGGRPVARHVIPVVLGPTGGGWWPGEGQTPSDIPIGKVLAVSPHGTAWPPRDGHGGPIADVGWMDEKGGLALVVEEGAPNTTTYVLVTVADD